MAPKPRLIRSPEDAEEAAAEWLRYIGFADAETTGSGADGGVDVVSSGVVAQVKAEMKPVGRPVVQQIFGIASHATAEAAVFSLSGFTPEAVEWADGAGVAFYEFNLQGDAVELNPAARQLVQAGSERREDDRKREKAERKRIKAEKEAERRREEAEEKRANAQWEKWKHVEAPERGLTMTRPGSEAEQYALELLNSAGYSNANSLAIRYAEYRNLATGRGVCCWWRFPWNVTMGGMPCDEPPIGTHIVCETHAALLEITVELYRLARREKPHLLVDSWLEEKYSWYLSSKPPAFRPPFSH